MIDTHDALHTHPDLAKCRDKRFQPDHTGTYFLLDVADGICNLLGLTGISLGKCLVHSAYALTDNFCQNGGTFFLRAELKNLFLRFVERVTVTAKGLCLAFHHLAKHRGNGGGTLLACLQTVLLGKHIIHHRDKFLKTGFFLEIGGKFLSSGHLHLIADDAKILLDCTQFLDAFDFRLCGIHRVTHHLGNLSFGCLLDGIGSRIFRHLRGYLTDT